MTPSGPRLLAGSRSSRLALAQTKLVTDWLAVHAPNIRADVRPIETTGDRSKSALLGDGVFVKEIQRSLLDGTVDFAVHSLKDVPTEPVEGISLAAVLPREDPRDLLFGATMKELRSGARVGTGSPRRSSQLLAARGDVVVEPIRGNVPTRIGKVTSGELDAVVIALAGVRRLGLEPRGEVLDTSVFLPAPGQGAIAVEVRSDDEATADLLRALDHPQTRIAVLAERQVLRNLGGGCLLPVSTLGVVHEDGTLLLEARVVSADGSKTVSGRKAGDSSDFDSIAQSLSLELVEKGALELLR